MAVGYLLNTGGERDEVLVDGMANDLVGARLAIRAALTAPTHSGIPGVAREERERKWRKARDLLRVVLGASA